MRGLLLATLLLAPLLAGCAKPEAAPPPPVKGLTWPTLAVETTHEEPEPARGDLLVAWADGVTGISAPGEGGMPIRTIIKGGEAYTTDLGIGWERGVLADRVGARQLTTRAVLWDVARLTREPALSPVVQTEGPWTNVTGGGTLLLGSYELPITFSVAGRDGTVVSARVASPAGRESPYTFTVAKFEFPFPLVVPANSRTRAEIEPLNNDAQPAHAHLVGLITQYRDTHGGTLPENVDPGTLQVEVLASGEGWPTNPFSGNPVQQQRASGDFEWRRCTLSTGRYVGFGHDGQLLSQGYGAGCA